jgi:hypothetical protein
VIAGKARANAKLYSQALGETGGKKSNGMSYVSSHDSILTIQTVAERISLRAFHYVPPQKIQKILHEKIEISPSFTRQNIEQT